MDRDLTSDERDVLYAFLDAMDADGFPGAAEYRAQAATARVTGMCGCGCPSPDFSVDESLPLAPKALKGIFPISACFDANPGEERGSEVLLWQMNGRIHSLEHVSFEDPISQTFPPLTALSERITIDRK